MTKRVNPARSATAELFHLRRIGVVDTAWHLGFVVGFGLAGIQALGTLGDGLNHAPARAMLRYIVTICLAGLAMGVVGVGCGHLVATAWERIDLRRHPRRFESA